MQIDGLYNYRILNFYTIHMVWRLLHDLPIIPSLAAAEDIYQFLGRELLE